MNLNLLVDVRIILINNKKIIVITKQNVWKRVKLTLCIHVYVECIIIKPTEYNTFRTIREVLFVLNNITLKNTPFSSYNKKNYSFRFIE